ncbi:hypothetical protein LEP1GSC170_0306 [Leptospira interrogans serovar Bataviae str. HAI135]|nr:hypothetical protein LEP1GSC170_0306 [Leptospira interrogans serovar Bataviae str. HAI135]
MVFIIRTFLFLGIHLLKKEDSALSNENLRSSSIGIIDEIRNFFPIKKLQTHPK